MKQRKGDGLGPSHRDSRTGMIALSPIRKLWTHPPACRRSSPAGDEESPACRCAPFCPGFAAAAVPPAAATPVAVDPAARAGETLSYSGVLHALGDRFTRPKMCAFRKALDGIDEAALPAASRPKPSLIGKAEATTVLQLEDVLPTLPQEVRIPDRSGTIARPPPLIGLNPVTAHRASKARTTMRRKIRSRTIRERADATSISAISHLSHAARKQRPGAAWTRAKGAPRLYLELSL